MGKTSLGQSIARATNRKFVRMALGGVRDEAEIRGHRRTYIGSMPGQDFAKPFQGWRAQPAFPAGRGGQDWRGPSAAIRPQPCWKCWTRNKNHTFSDHYVEVDFDLSDVMFIATSNSLNIPAPLLDRMEVIRLAGYTEDEKTNIAQKYLIPKQIKGNGLKAEEINITEAAIRDIVRYYTREAGVRALEREISKICRKVVKVNLLKKQEKKTTVSPRNTRQVSGCASIRLWRCRKRQSGWPSGRSWHGRKSAANC